MANLKISDIEVNPHGHDHNELYNIIPEVNILLPPVIMPPGSYGYCVGGFNMTSYFSTIDRILFPFNSGNASIVGNLTQTKYCAAGFEDFLLFW